MEFCIILAFIAAAAAFALAMFVMFREGHSIVQKSLTLGLVVLASEAVMAGLAGSALLSEEVIFWQRLRLLAMALTPGVWLIFSLTYSRGNSGEFLKRWAVAVGAAFLLPVLVFAIGWRHLLGMPYLTADSPTWVVPLGTVGTAHHLLYLIGLVVVLANLESTLRNATGTMRWRVKFMILGAGLVFAVRLYGSTQALLYSSIEFAPDALNAGALLVGCGLMMRALFRAHLLSADIYLSRSLLYQSLTVGLVGAYLLVVGVLSRIATYFGKHTVFPLGAFIIFVAIIGLSTLVLSDRVRQQTKLLVSRHLRRPQYDYRRIWASFSGRAGGVTEVPTFCRAVANLISETLDVLSVTIWVTDEKGDRLAFGGSTSLSATHAQDMALSKSSPEAMEALRAADAPFELGAEVPARSAAGAVAKFSSAVFEKGGNRVCVPLKVGDEVLGMALLGDRVRGLPYTVEEFDLLRTLGGQVSASLLNMRLGARLMEAKQLEAFQTMSTFFVHDLKNTASTLSLMLQNLPQHFADPAFRDDALKAISKSVGKINDLIRRLTLLREKLDIKPIETDLIALVTGTLDSLGDFFKGKIVKELDALPKVALDPDHMAKVVTNLLLNARDATGPDGEIRIQARQKNGWATLSVSDNGAGMTREFMERSLFRPFRTTKREGIGIGLFQSRMVVEAHKGRIEVESEPGVGSTFRLLLPLQGGQFGSEAHDRR